jgi:hypothetical protein
MAYRRSKLAEYIVVKNKSTGYVAELRRQALRAGMGRIIVLDALTTMVTVSKSHSAKWIERFAKQNRATVLERHALPPEDTYRAACGVELLTYVAVRRHESTCKRCKARVNPDGAHRQRRHQLPVDIRSDTQRQITEEADKGNTTNQYQAVTVSNGNGGVIIDPTKLDPGTSVRPPQPEPIKVTLDLSADAIEATMTRIIDRSLALAGEVELALRTVSRRAEIEAEITALQAEYEGLVRDAQGQNPFAKQAAAV